VIRVERVEKRYGGRRVLRGVTFALQRGEAIVVTGPNGSGKTTLLRLVAGLAAPTSGEVELDVDRGRVGYLGHEPLVYRELTAVENLELYGRLYRIPERRERVGMLLERYGLWAARNERVGGYSRGMVQRLALCRVLLHAPYVLVLDEPHTALDAEGAELLDRELDRLRGTTTMVIATHDPERLAPLGTSSLALVTA
jgi:heme ABC exporter ATP-binding subunit CcmA